MSRLGKFLQPDDGIIMLPPENQDKAIAEAVSELTAEFVADELSNLEARELEWSEELHPRDERGRFGPGGLHEKEESFLSSPDDAVRSLLNGEHVTVAATDVRSVVMEAKDMTTPIDLTRLTVEDKQIFAGGLNRDRLSMPQIPKEQQQAFLDSLKKEGIVVTKESVAPSSLLPTQNEISANRVGASLAKYDQNKDKILRPPMVSKDNYVLDGHHRWAVMAVIDVENPRLSVKMPILRMGQNHREALRTMATFNKKHGIKGEMLEAWRSMAARDNTPIHQAADAQVKNLTVAVMYAFLRAKKAYRAGGTDAALNALRIALEATMPKALLAALVAGGEVGAALLNKTLRAAELRIAKGPAAPPVKMRFDKTNPAAAKWAREHAAELIDDVTATTKQSIKDAIAHAQEGEGLRESYDEILDAIGDENRAQLIARTESMAAANEGNRQSWDQAVENGLLTGEEKRTWIATSDACPECDDLDGEETSLDGSYPGEGEDGPPLHPNCRCTEGIVG